MLHRRQFLLAMLAAPGALTLATPSFAAAATSLPPATDLAADASSAGAQGIPVLILYSLPGCPYCEAIRRAHLIPMLAETPPRALLRQVDIDSSRTMQDFQGKPISHQDFAKREGITLTPVVAFHGPGGAPVAERLIGAMLPDFYGSYLDDALTKAATAIHAGRAENPSRR